MAGTLLSRLGSLAGTKTFVTAPVSEKKKASSEACLEMLDFPRPLNYTQVLDDETGPGRGQLLPQAKMKKARLNIPK